MSEEARRAVEAILMVADRPVDPHLLAQVTETSPAAMDELLAELAAVYEGDDRGFVLVKVAGGYRFQSHPDLTGYVERFVLEGQNARLSSAALETMAIIAYKQPISRAQIASIRGVNVDGVVRTLEQRGYIAELSRDPGPGQAVLFGTTDAFLERIGVNSLDDLPSIAEFVPGADVVEALEHGLRVDPVEIEIAAEQDSGTDDRAPEPSDHGAATLIDLDDPD
jgi:segregation and condensation protein B